MTTLKKLPALLTITFLCLLSFTPGMRAQQVTGVSAILDVSNGNITTYSATEVDYNTSAYYEPYVEGYLYENGTLIGSGSATANTNSNCDGNISSQIAEGCIQKPDSVGSTYQIQSDHYLITAFAYTDGGGTSYYSNPEGFLGAPGGYGPDYSTFGPGGGPTYVNYQFIYLGTTAVNGTVEQPDTNTPVLTGIQPNVWQSGQTTPGVVFSGQYFGTNPPTLTFSPGDGISYTVTSSNDTQIVADVTVGQGTPDENISVSVTSNGNNGQAFAPVGGGQPTGGPITASVRNPVNSPEVTVIAWVNGPAITLPSGANPTMVSNLNSFGADCVFQVTDWSVLRVASNIDTPTDRDYANSWLVKYSDNPGPPPTINAQDQLNAGNYRLFNLWGGSSRPTSRVGSTPNPCHTAFPPEIFRRPEPSTHNGDHGTTASGNSAQLVEGRIGTRGQVGSRTINPGLTIPWIWSAIEFDASGNLVSTPHEQFPTYSVYVNGQLTNTYPQSDVLSFIHIASGEGNQITSVSQLP